MAKRLPVVILILTAVVIVGIVVVVRNPKSLNTQNPQSEATREEDNESKPAQFTFSDPKISAHFEGSTPSQAAVFPGAPVNVVIDFNFNLASNSLISISKDGKEFGIGETKVDSNKLSMRKSMNPNSPDGKYLVSYNACWPDKTCDDGHFEFAIDRNTAKDFKDMTGKQTVLINMANLQFDPVTMVIDKGTKVTWINGDDTTHFVNTDSHTAHTYLPDMNSEALEKGESYSYTFKAEGFYPYHCSAHADTMRGGILVQ